MRKTYCFVLPMLALLLSGCEFGEFALNSQRIRGSGKVSRVQKSVSGFRAVKFATVGEVTLEQGANESLEIEAEENLLPHIRVEVQGRNLLIATERGVNISPTVTIRYRLTVKEIDAIELSGSGKFTTAPLNCGEMRLELTGSGDIRLGGLTAQALEASISGSGNIDVPGKVGRVTVEISGSGDFEGSELESESGEVSISGSGDATVWARDRLTVSISGSGDVDYFGEPGISKHISGSGNVRSRGARK